MDMPTAVYSNSNYRAHCLEKIKIKNHRAHCAPCKNETGIVHQIMNKVMYKLERIYKQNK